MEQDQNSQKKLSKLKKEEQENKKKGILWLLSWVLSFSLLVTVSKTLDENIPTLSLVMIRTAFGVISLFPFLLHSGLKKSMP